MAISGNKYLLDTTVYIDYLRSIPVARKIIFDTRTPKFMCGFSIITEAELWAGMRKFDTPATYKSLLQPYNRYFINITIARRAGKLRRLIQDALGQGGSAPEIADCIIAATAEYHNLTVYTRNETHFKHFISHSINVQFYKP